MNKNDLIKSQKIEFFGENYEKTLSVYIDMVEHFIFIGDLKAAKRLMDKLGFKEKNSTAYIKTIIDKYDDEDSKYLQMIMNNKVKRSLLN
tara:strand:+ start:94 stop:363 length:270 start_codon:yes stop_codon:yes gene_type:complete